MMKLRADTLFMVVMLVWNAQGLGEGAIEIHETLGACLMAEQDYRHKNGSERAPCRPISRKRAEFVVENADQLVWFRNEESQWQWLMGAGS